MKWSSAGVAGADPATALVGPLTARLHNQNASGRHEGVRSECIACKAFVADLDDVVVRHLRKPKCDRCGGELRAGEFGMCFECQMK